jgi:hypothetical protein
LSLVLALMLHGAALRFGLPLTRVLTGQDPQLLNQLTLELR